MNNTFRSKMHDRSGNRFVAPASRFSGAQHTMGAIAPASVAFAYSQVTEPGELRRMNARVLNLQMLLKGLFDDSIAAMAAYLEMSPDRLRALMDMQTPFSSEIAEHLEKILRLPGGWLDNQRASIDVERLRAIVFGKKPADGAAPSEAEVEPVVAQSVEQRVAVCEHPRVVETVKESVLAHESSGSADSSPIESNTEERDHEMINVIDTQKPQEDVAKPVTPPLYSGAQRKNDAMAQTLRWLNSKLDHYRAPNGAPARAVLRARLGRAQSTVSTWLNGLRNLPDEMAVPLARAVVEMKLPVAAEFLERMFAAAPGIFTDNIQQNLRSMLQEQLAQSATVMATPMVAAASSPANSAAQQTTTQLQKAATTIDLIRELQHLHDVGTDPGSAEFKLVIARAAEKVADVLQRLVR